MNRANVMRSGFERSAAILRLNDGVSLALKKSAYQAPQIAFVFHQENGFSSRRGFDCAALRLRNLGACYARQINFECGAAVDFAVYPDVAAALLHDAVHGRKPKPAAFRSFRRKERFEDV